MHILQTVPYICLVILFSPNTTKPRQFVGEMVATYKCHIAYHFKCKGLLGLLPY